MYVSKVGVNRWLLGRWKDRLKKYISETGVSKGQVFEQAVRECLDRGGGGSFAGVMLLEGVRY